MKEVVNMNIGRRAFAIDQDACSVLQEYLDDIRSRLSDGDAETLVDIEMRFAEIFSERCSSPMQVVTLEMVRAAMVQMGAPADFGERRASALHQQAYSHRLYRSRNGVIGGVCGGLAEYFGIDPTLVRLLTLALVIFAGLSIWVYIILWILIPVQSEKESSKK